MNPRRRRGSRAPREGRLYRSLLDGAAAGAAGTATLNAVTYLDLAVRGRPASSTPQDSIERLAAMTGVPVPGDGETRDNRVDGLAALLGMGTGVGAGLALAALRGLGWRPPLAVDVVAASGLALAGGNVPMALIGVSDPRSWSASDWLADLVPHLAYGLVAVGVLRAMDPHR